MKLTKGLAQLLFYPEFRELMFGEAMNMYKYIIVDDEFLSRKGLLKKIDSLNLSLQLIGEAENGAAGLELIDEKNPDIIFTDMKMPVMDGMDFLETINKRYANKKVIVISGYTNYEYMHKAINSNVIGYILKPFNKDEIEELITKAICMLESERDINTKIDFLQQEIHDIKYHMDIEKLQSIIKMPPQNHNFLYFNNKELNVLNYSNNIILISIFSNSSINSEDIDAVQCSLKLKRKYIFIQDSEDKTQYFLITFYDENEINNELQRIGEAVKNILLENNSNMYVCISHAKASLYRLHEAYIENLNLLDLRNLKDANRIYEPCSMKSSTESMPWDKYKEMVYAIKSNNESKVQCLVDEFFDIYENNDEFSFSSVKNACVSFNNAISNYLAIMGIDVSINFTYDFNEKYRFETSVTNIKKDFIEFYFNLLKNIHNNDTNNPELVYRIKQYIENNYNSKITLELIASKFFINPSYCSYMYKEKTGENINEYLTKIRMEKSKNLLKETHKSIDIISKEVGYRNTKYFFKIFKKYVGFTPLEYRNEFLS